MKCVLPLTVFILTLSVLTDASTSVITIDKDRVLVGLVIAHTNCVRDCTKSTKSLNCYFNFTLENYNVMGQACGQCADGVEADCDKEQCVPADGVERGMMSINRMLPGPDIQVCQGDKLIIDVENRIHGDASTIHWHGLFQRGSPHMDGVPMITQCPIHTNQEFRYFFKAAEKGTHYYHSHTGYHKADGHYGSLIVREKDDELEQYYQHDLPEHVMLLSDWNHEPASNSVPGLRHRADGIYVQNLLINGRGNYYNTTTLSLTKTPLAKFYVKSKEVYRFRVINGASLFCPIELQVENHTLTILALDGKNVQPEVINSFVTVTGERVDFTINANQPPGIYWIRARGLGRCAANGVEQFGMLVYDLPPQTGLVPNSPKPKYSEPWPIGVRVGNSNATCGINAADKCITDLKSTEENNDLLTRTPDHKLYFEFGFKPQDTTTFFNQKKYKQFVAPLFEAVWIGAFNKRTFVYPTSPLLTQFSDARSDNNVCYSDSASSKCGSDSLCECTQIVKVRKNALVEIVLVQEGGGIDIINHPFHLHGHDFLVTRLGQLNGSINVDIIKQMDETTPLPRLTRFAPRKDTVSIPSNGYAIIRFVADNPGFWFFHCHLEWHLNVGMGTVFQVGDEDQMTKQPLNFPRCGNYLPFLFNF